jgi:hypothetical protein
MPSEASKRLTLISRTLSNRSGRLAAESIKLIAKSQQLKKSIQRVQQRNRNVPRVWVVERAIVPVS